MNLFPKFIPKFCLLSFVCAAWAGCADDGAAEPGDPVPSIRLEEENRSLVFAPEEGTAEIWFQVEGAWRAVVSAPADEWCGVTPSKGGAGTAWVRVKVAENTSELERNATIMIRCGDVSKNVVVTQKGIDALTLTRSKFEMEPAGGTVEVEVESNVSFDYEIDVECRDWIEAENTRGMQTSKLRFRVASYEGGPVRAGHIRVFGGGREETVRVYQEGSDPAIVVSQDEYVLSAAAGTIQVDLCSNVDYEVGMPDAEWIEDVSTRVLSSHTLYFAVAENTSEEDRSAVIRFTDRATGVANSVRILQKGKDAAVVSKDFYKISPAGGYVVFDVRYNNAVKLHIPCDWIERVYRRWTRSTQTEEVILKIDASEGNLSREAEVSILGSDDEILRKIRIVQSDELSAVISPDESLLPWEGGDCVVSVQPGIPFSFEIYSGAKDWLRHVKTVGSEVYFHVERNQTGGPRSAYIGFTSPVLKFASSVDIEQMAENALAAACDSYDVPNEGGEIEVEVLYVPGYAFTVDISDDWIEQIETRGYVETLRFKAAPNPDDTYRVATVRLVPDDGSPVQKFRIFQLPEHAVVVSEHEYTLPAEGGLSKVEIRATGDYTVADPEVGWLHRNVETRNSGKNSIYYTADPNETYESREAEVVVRNTTTGEEERVRFVQLQKNALVVAQSLCTVGLEGGTLVFDVEANVPLEVEIEAQAREWLSHVETRAFGSRLLRFEAAPADEEREGLIAVSGGGITQMISVLQSASADPESIERKALAAFYRATGGGNWKKSDGWCSDRPVGTWYGVTVSGGRVTEIRLPDNGLSGRIPAEIGDLKGLLRLDLKDNRITGSLPDVFGQLQRLGELDLSGNGMGGDLPGSMGALSQLRVLNLSRNDFTGRLPESFRNLSELTEIRASEAGLMGSIAPVAEGSPLLEVVDLSSNAFTGPIPDAVYGLSRLRSLELRGNPLSGLISAAIGNLEQLETLDLSSTCISGDLPRSIGHLARLHTLDLHDAQMSGPLPDVFGRMYALETLRLEHNRFSGTLPSGLLMREPLWRKCWGSVLDQYGEGLSGYSALPAPEFIVRDMNDEVLSSGQIYSEKELTVLFQFSTEDAESGRAVSKLNAMYDDYRQYGMQIVGYAYEPLEEIREYADRMRIEWPVVCVGDEHPANEIHRVSFFPAINIVDRESQVVWNCFEGTDDDAFAFIRDWFKEYEPYESTDYSADKQVQLLQKATRGAGINIVLMGDGFTDRNIRDGVYEATMRTAMEHFFEEEPFASFRSCFNVYAVTAVSKHEGYFKGSKNALGTYFKTGAEVGGDNELCREYALAVPAITEEDLDETLIVVLMNSGKYAGTSYLAYSGKSGYGSGCALCYFPLGKDDEMFAQLLHHEAGGHGFAKLADEYDTSFLPMPQDKIDDYEAWEPYGWWRNVDFTADPASVKWSRFLSDSRYDEERLGVFEGACGHIEGAYRPSENSIMRDNAGGFNAPSREAIYMRIMWLAYGPEWGYDYEEFVLWDARNRAAARVRARSTAPRRRYGPLPPPVVVQDR